MQRRGFLTAALAAGFAPAAVGSGILMPINTKIIGSARKGAQLVFGPVQTLDQANVRELMIRIEQEVQRAIQFHVYETNYGDTIQTIVKKMADERGLEASLTVEGSNLNMVVSASSILIASRIEFA